MKKTEINTLSMPIVALRGLVIFPDMRLHFDVGRKKSVTALKAAMTGNQEVFLVAQNDIIDDDPDVKGLYKTGVVAKVKQVLKLQGSDNVRVAVEGIYRAKIVGDIEMKPYLRGNVKPCGDTKIKPADAEYTEALVRHAKDIFNDYSVAAPQLPPDLILAVIAKKGRGNWPTLLPATLCWIMPTDRRFWTTSTPSKGLRCFAYCWSGKASSCSLKTISMPMCKSRLTKTNENIICVSSSKQFPVSSMRAVRKKAMRSITGNK